MKTSVKQRINCYMENLPWFWKQTKEYKLSQKTGGKNEKNSKK